MAKPKPPPRTTPHKRDVPTHPHTAWRRTTLFPRPDEWRGRQPMISFRCAPTLRVVVDRIAKECGTGRSGMIVSMLAFGSDMWREFDKDLWRLVAMASKTGEPFAATLRRLVLAGLRTKP